MKQYLTTIALLASASVLSAQTLVTSNITSDTTWNGEYVLDGPIFVKGDSTLTILPGSIIRGQPRRKAGSAIGDAPGSLIVTRGSRIEALGNKSAPIIFTTAAIDNDAEGTAGFNIPDGANGFLTGWSDSSDTFYDDEPATNPLGLTAAGAIEGNTTSTKGDLNNDNTELWGGLIILGKAPINYADDSTTGQAYIEGLTASADTLYGGYIANDDSGILQYVSVRHGGDEIGTGNEINGITLGGVGFGTIIEYCEVYLNYDDGFEWFGGTVNGNHLMVSMVGDDSFDGDQGWIGQVQYAFAVQPHIGIGVTGGDEGFEFDGDDAPDVNEDLAGNVVPLPSYAFANFTIVGPTGATGYTNSIDANARITVRAGFVGDLYNGYVVNCKGSFLSYDATSALLDTITVDDSTDTSIPTGTGLTTANIVLPAAASGLIGEDQASENGLNPRPISSGFPAPAGITSSISLPAPFETTTYVGAFPTTTSLNLWTEGWTALNISGILVD